MPYTPTPLLRSVAALARLASPRPRRYTSHYERVLGTSLELQVVASSAKVAGDADAAVLAEVDRLDAILSGWSATSELSQWQGHGDESRVSPELAYVLLAAEAWRVRTNGAFNPAASSLIELLRDESNVAIRRSAIDERLREMAGPLWSVDLERGVAQRLTRLHVSLDALAKGYIVDRLAERASAMNGVSQVLVNIGGDLRHCGDRPVPVAVADPRAPAENAPPIAVVRLLGEALATSGDYRRGFAMDGRTVSHIIDPRTGVPAGRVISASVLAPDCATADALSTAFSVLEPRESIALADSLPRVACLLVERDGTITTNAEWQAHTS